MGHDAGCVDYLVRHWILRSIAIVVEHVRSLVLRKRRAASVVMRVLQIIIELVGVVACGVAHVGCRSSVLYLSLTPTLVADDHNCDEEDTGTSAQGVKEHIVFLVEETL